MRETGLFLVTLIALDTVLSRGAAIERDAGIVAAQTLGAFRSEFLPRLIAAVTVNGTIMLPLIPFGAWTAFGLASLILIGNGSVLAGAVLFGFGALVMTIGDNVVPTAIGSAVELPFLLAMIGAFGGLAELGQVGLFVGQ